MHWVGQIQILCILNQMILIYTSVLGKVEETTRG